MDNNFSYRELFDEAENRWEQIKSQERKSVNRARNKGERMKLQGVIKKIIPFIKECSGELINADRKEFQSCASFFAELQTTLYTQERVDGFKDVIKRDEARIAELNPATDGKTIKEYQNDIKNMNTAIRCALLNMEDYEETRRQFLGTPSYHVLSRMTQGIDKDTAYYRLRFAVLFIKIQTEIEEIEREERLNELFEDDTIKSETGRVLQKEYPRTATEEEPPLPNVPQPYQEHQDNGKAVDSCGRKEERDESTDKASPSKGRKAKDCYSWIKDVSKKDEILKDLHSKIDHLSKGSTADIVSILRSDTRITKPTYSQAKAEFPNIGAKSGYNSQYSKTQ